MENVPAGKSYADNTLMQWLMQHGLWFHQVHRSSWLLPWHRQYLYEMEKQLIRAWLTIRCDHDKLKLYGWPSFPHGGLVANAEHTDADGVTSYVASPCTLCIAIPYWHHPHDAEQLPNKVRLAPYDPYTFGGSGLGSRDGCFNTSQFGRAKYTVGNWAMPQRALPNARAHAGYWGSAQRCLRRTFDGSKRTPFINQLRLDALLSRCDEAWVDWQAEFERQVPSHPTRRSVPEVPSHPMPLRDSPLRHHSPLWCPLDLA
jgi:hypothetical protein